MAVLSILRTDSRKPSLVAATIVFLQLIRTVLARANCSLNSCIRLIKPPNTGSLEDYGLKFDKVSILHWEKLTARGLIWFWIKILLLFELSPFVFSCLKQFKVRFTG
jgi:hypothetical protein